MTRALLFAALLLVAVGCGVQGGAAPVPAGSPVADAAVPGPVAPLPAATPTRLRIPAIGAASTLIPLGLNADGTVEVPSLDDPMQAGWYRYGPTPGQVGPAVVLGHVNARGSQGVFARLAELAPGDQVSIDRDDGHTVGFTVRRVEEVPKTQFPTGRVYGDTQAPELRLVTCGGELDRARHSYRDSIIVYAVLTSER
ncbi:MAG TPA: class F sortase [Pseudonocardiaceae bacterium]